MKIFKYKENNKNYIIEIKKSPYPFMDGNSRLGVHAYPHNWKGDNIFFKSIDFDGACMKFIENNFNVITEI